MPELKTLSTARQTMAYMLQNCTSLTSITTKLSSWNSNATVKWLSGASSTGTFALLDPACVPSRDESGVPAGWTMTSPQGSGVFDHYVDYVTTNQYKLDTQYIPTARTSFEIELSGDVQGTGFVGFMDNDTSDYRLFNSGTTMYFDIGSERLQQQGYSTTSPAVISCWNFGFACT